MSSTRPDPGVEALKALLREAWDSRSPAERDKFAPIFVTAGDAGLGDTAADKWTDWSSSSTGYEGDKSASGELTARRIEQVRATEILAALSGGIQPRELVAEYPQAVAEQLLDLLAPNFDRTLVASNWIWTLKSERRTQVLHALDLGCLPALLNEASRVPTDAAGVLLRKLLLEGVAVLDGAEIPESARLQAMHWASSCRPEIEKQLDLQRRKAAVASLFDMGTPSRADQFFGRTAETKAIKDFVASIRGRGLLQVLRVSGVGGIGKTTLLAHVLQPMAVAALEQRDQPMIAYINFDRLGLLRGGELELSFELSRQIGLFEPALAADLGRLRERMARDRASRGESFKRPGDSGIESISRHSNEFESNAKHLLYESRIQYRPLVVIIDAFEERQRQFYDSYMEHSLAQILAWLTTVRDTWSLQAGAIVSGRTPESTRSHFHQTIIDIGEIGSLDSTKLLQSVGLPARAATKLAKIVGGNPLNLMLAGRHYLTLPLQQRTDFLKSVTGALDGINAAMRQGMLYKRFLQHIPDSRVRSLAHPGLALRRVTADLIRHVLAKPCALGAIDDAEASALFYQLGKEVWLVEKSGAELIHRPDTRRMMIRFMRDDPQFTERIYEIHGAAASWYASRQPPLASDLVEASYHLLMGARWGEEERLVGQMSLSVVQALAESLEDFPDWVRAAILYRLGLKLRLTDAQWLPLAERAKWMRDRAEQAVQQGQPELALEAWKELAPEHAPGPWYAAAVFQSGRWDPAEPLIDANHDYNRHLLSYHFLMVLALEERKSPAAPSLLANLSDIVRYQQLQSRKNPDGADLLAILENIYFLTLIGGRVASQEHRKAAWNLRATSDNFSPGTTTYLRIAPLARMQHRMLHVTHSRHILAGAFRPTPDYLDTVEELVKQLGGQRKRLQDFRCELEASMGHSRRGGGESADVLGSWADEFSVAVEEAFPAHSIDALLGTLLKGQRSDDPEWRAPIRLTLAATTRSHGDLYHAPQAICELLDPWIPSDLRVGNLTSQLHRSPRSAWLKVVEYLDRCGKLPEFMQQFTEHDDPRLRMVASAYLRWVALGNDFLRVSDPLQSSENNLSNRKSTE